MAAKVSRGCAAGRVGSPRQQSDRRAALGYVVAIACLVLSYHVTEPPVRPHLVRQLAVRITALTVAFASVAQAQRVPKLQPTHYSSRSGEFDLFVDPSDPDGDGPAAYEVRRDGELVWTREEPFSFYEAAVFDDGSAVGYVYTQGLRGAGDLLVVIFDPCGEAVVSDAHPRQNSGAVHGSPWPIAKGLLVHNGLARAIVRVHDFEPDGQRDHDFWWCYDLQSPEVRPWAVRPDAMLSPHDGVRWAAQACELPGTPLVLAYWFVASWSDSERGRHTGALFTLLDAELRPVWQLDLYTDYDRLEALDEDGVIDRIREQGAILGVMSGGRFDLRHVTEEARVSYVAEPDPNAATGWNVREVSREPYDEPTPEQPAVVPIQLDLLATTPIATGTGARSAIRDIIDYAFAPDGSIGFVRDDEEHVTIVGLDAVGGVQSEVEVELPVHLERHGEWAALQSEGWLCALPRKDADERLDVLRLGSGDGSVTSLGTFPGNFLSVLAAMPDGGFLLLSEASLLCCDATGEVRWHVEEGYRDPAKLFSPEDVTVTADGRVAVIDNISKVIQLYSLAGDFQEAVDLVHVLGQEPNYLSGVEPDPDGGLLVEDFDGEPPLWRLSAANQVIARVTPSDPNGLTAGDLARRARVAPDGTIWTTDGRIFAELDPSGAVARVVGESAQADVLHEPGATYIDALGRVVIQDERTANVHVFDAAGEPVAVGRASVNDLPFVSSISNIGVAGDGSVFVEQDYKDSVYFAFDPRGERMDMRDFGSEQIAFVPRSLECWGVRERRIVRSGATGEVLICIERRPDHKHFEAIESIAIAPDGRVAVLDGSDLLCYEKDGKPVAVYALPDTYSNLAYSGRWAATSDWNADVLLLDCSTGTRYQFAVPTDAERPQCRYGFSPDGSELWVVLEKPLTLFRFALP